MSCGTCETTTEEKHDHEHQENHETYKCSVCGNTSTEPKTCCEKPMEKVCKCGSGKVAKECCEAGTEA